MGGGETVQIVRRSATATDAHGNPTYSESTLTVEGVLVAPGGTSEPVDPARNAVDATLTLYFPAGTNILDGDKFIVRDSEWVKDGMPQEWLTPFAFLQTGVVVPVRKRRG